MGYPLALFLSMLAVSQSSVGQKVARTEISPPTLKAALASYYENNLDRALSLLQQASSLDTNNADILAWMAEVYRRTDRHDDAIRTAARSLSLDSCNGLAHFVAAETSRLRHWEPRSDSVWYHLNRAIQCDTTDGSAWMSFWNEAVLRGDIPAMQLSVRRLYETGFLTPAMLAYSRWVLKALPNSAILITNGDMDTYPLLAIQEVEGLRNDVVVAERGLLNTEQFLRYIRDYRHVTVPIPTAQLESLFRARATGDKTISVMDTVFRSWLAQRDTDLSAQPITISVTVDSAFYAQATNRLINAGSFLIWQRESTQQSVDTAALRRAISSIRISDFSGPWVSVLDRSPIRRLYTKYMAEIITEVAVTYAKAMMQAGKPEEAANTLNWADTFESATELGPVMRETIQSLRESIDK